VIPVMRTLVELEQALAPLLVDNNDLYEVLQEHSSAVLDLVDVPLKIEVGVEHWRAAVALATAFIDGELFVSELSTESHLSAGSPERRAAVIYALVQLIADILAYAVNPDRQIDQETADAAALHLLAKLALFRGVA
jgi:hypothetical protein